MRKKILFVVEGKKTESQTIINIFKRVMKISSEEIEVYKYKTNIYSLCDILNSGEYDSLIDYLRVNAKHLFKDEIKPSDCFSSIYLIFDLDPQDSRFSINKIQFLVNYFSDETQDGKIYFNYPMMESLFDFKTLNQRHFNNKTISKIGLNSDKYKAKVNKSSFVKCNKGCSIKKDEILYKVLNLHINKYFNLINLDRDDNHYSNQELLLDAEKYYLANNKISIINSSVLILNDYNACMIESLMDNRK